MGGGTQYPMYSGRVASLSERVYKVGETSIGMRNGPNVVAMSNADGDTLTLSEAAMQAMQMSSHSITLGAAQGAAGN